MYTKCMQQEKSFKEKEIFLERKVIAKIVNWYENIFKEFGRIDAPTPIYVKKYSRIYLSQLSEDGETRKKIGLKLREMNIERKRDAKGKYIDLSDEKTRVQLEYLFKHFHVYNQ